MKKISGKINLMMLNGVIKKLPGQDGEVECLVLPIEINRLFKGDKGVYLDLIAFPIEPAKQNESKDTHLVKQSFSKKQREKMGEEELKMLPILGNLKEWDTRGESEPASSMVVQEEKDDLPF